MQKLGRILTVAVALTGASPTMAPADQVGHEGVALYSNLTNLRSIDTAVARVIWIFRDRADFEVRYQVVPWNRLHRYLGKMANACGITVGRTPQFSDSYRWLRPTVSSSVVVYELPDITTYEAARPVAALRGSSSFHLARAKGIAVAPEESRAQIVAKLADRRVAAWIDLELVIATALDEAGVPPLRRRAAVGDITTWLACSRSTDDAVTKALIDIWDTAHADGTLRTVYGTAGIENLLPTPRLTDSLQPKTASPRP